MKMLFKMNTQRRRLQYILSELILTYITKVYSCDPSSPTSPGLEPLQVHAVDEVIGVQRQARVRAAAAAGGSRAAHGQARQAGRHQRAWNTGEGVRGSGQRAVREVAGEALYREPAAARRREGARWDRRARRWPSACEPAGRRAPSRPPHSRRPPRPSQPPHRSEPGRGQLLHFDVRCLNPPPIKYIFLAHYSWHFILSRFVLF